MEYVECPTCALAYTWYKLNGRTNDKPALEREYSVRCVCGTEFDVTPYEVIDREEERKLDWRFLWAKTRLILSEKHLEVSLNIRTE